MFARLKNLDMLRNLERKCVDDVFKTPVLQQTAFWSKVKNRLGVDSLAFNFNVRSDSIVSGEQIGRYYRADILVLIQRLGNDTCYAYLPYGPEVEPEDHLTGPFLEELSEQLKEYLPKGCIFIRYDLAWRSFWETSAPEKEMQELRVNIGTNYWNLKKTQSNMLPSNTIFLNLKKGSDLLLSGMKPKTRYNINLSYRKGVEIRHAGVESLHIWYELYRETANRNSFYLHPIEYFRAILTAHSNNTESPADVSLLIAEYYGTPVAAMFLVISHNRATYLYGASSEMGRKIMATYALQWFAINFAKQCGCTEYDMFGVSPTANESHPMYGLYRFKSGFGGEIKHSLGCWDYPLNSHLYTLYTAQELSMQSYHIV